jgi:hypothetical protein
MSGYSDDLVRPQSRNNSYDSVGSREPIWTRVSNDPEDQVKVVSAEKQQSSPNAKVCMIMLL